MFLVLLGVGYLIYLTYGKKLLAEGRKGQIKIAVIAGGLLILFAVATGRANVLLAPLGAAMALFTRFQRYLPFVAKFFPQIKAFMGDPNAAVGAETDTGFGYGAGGPAGQGGASSGRSRMQTATLVMIFDHASGQMNGTVKRGQFEGYSLNELSVGELRELLKYCTRADPEAMRLLNVYLGRYYSQHFGGARSGPHGGGSAGAGAGPDGSGSSMHNGDMSEREAYDILGLEPGATNEQIIAAHRSLIGKMHPDKGGSTYLATKINAARDQLLQR